MLRVKTGVRADKYKSCRNCEKCSKTLINKKFVCSEGNREPWPKHKHYFAVSCDKFVLQKS